MRRLLPLLVALPLVALTACSGPAPVPSATTRVTVSASPAPTSTVTVTPSPSATPSGSASASASASTDPNRPADQCSDAHLSIGWRPASGGAGAGSDYIQLVFTNGASTACVLRGYPGVSVVGDGNGTQLGVPSGETSGSVHDVHLDAQGGQATALLRVTDIGSNGGPYGSRCPVKKGNGYRVYAPHSTIAHFVSRANVPACTSSVVWMSVSPVTEG